MGGLKILTTFLDKIIKHIYCCGTICFSLGRPKSRIASFTRSYSVFSTLIILGEGLHVSSNSWLFLFSNKGIQPFPKQILLI